MAGLPDLVVNLAANSQKLERGLTQAQGGIKGFASSAVSFLNPVTAGFAAVTAGAAAVGVGIYALTGRIEKLAGVADEAAKTGLSGKFLQQLEYAGVQSGVENLTGALQKMTIAIGKGGDEFRHLQGMSPEQQFRTIASEISSLATPAERAAAAVKYFGKSGLEMTGLFADGMKGVNALLQDAENLGIGLSDAALKKAADADDSIQRMYASFGALFDQVAVGVAPVFDEIAQYITDWSPPLTKFLDKFNELDGKIQFASDLIVAGFDVGMETIKAHWDQMLSDMWEATTEKLSAPLARLNPFQVAPEGGMERLRRLGVNPQANGLDAAKDRLNAVLGRLNQPKPAPAPAFAGGGGGFQEVRDNLRAMEAPGKLKELAGGIFDAVAGKIGEANIAGIEAITSAKLSANWWGGVVKDMFTGERPEAPKQENKLAGVMRSGSAEHYSSLAQAFVNRGKDPNVTATEKQTKALLAGMKANAPKFQKLEALK